MKKSPYLLIVYCLISFSVFAQSNQADFVKGAEAYKKRDYKTAMSWYQQAAAKGDSSGMLSVGLLYSAGQGVPADQQQAMQWFKKAADHGNPWGYLNMANMLLGAPGIPVDSAQAFANFQKSADMGLEVANINLGSFYENGILVKQDLGAAAYYFSRAGLAYQERFLQRQELLQAAKKSGKPLIFSSAHNFKAAFLPDYKHVVLHSAHGFKENELGFTYTGVDYRIIDLQNMQPVQLSKTAVNWDTDFRVKTRTGQTFSEMIYKTAYAPGTAPDSVRTIQEALIRPYLINNQDYDPPKWSFAGRLDDGSLIFAVVNKKADKEKADLEIYRQANVNSTSLDKYLTINGLKDPAADIVISANGRRLLYREATKGAEATVYDVRSQKKLTTVPLIRTGMYDDYSLIKFSSTGDSILTGQRNYLKLTVYNLKDGKVSVTDIPAREVFDENSEEYKFDENDKFKEITRDKSPVLMDYTPDGKRMLVASTNKVAILSTVGDKPLYIRDPAVTLQAAVSQRVYMNYMYPKFSALLVEIVRGVRDSVARANYAKWEANHQEAEAARLANEKSMAEYRRTHPFGNPPAAPKSTVVTLTKAPETEEERHRKAMEEINRSTERMNRHLEEKH